MSNESDPITASDTFDQVTARDSSSVFKPSMVSLVVTQSDQGGTNVMTAGWWMTAGYNPFRYMLGVGHHTYTYELLQDNPEFVLAAPTTDMVDALTLCGAVSGRDIDKISHLDLETRPATELQVPLLADAAGNVECTVLDSFTFGNCTYYLGGVEAAHIRRDGLDGRIIKPELNPLAYLGSDWKNPDDKEKHRYYLEFDADNVSAYPGEDILETIPDEQR